MNFFFEIFFGVVKGFLIFYNHFIYVDFLNFQGTIYSIEIKKKIMKFLAEIDIMTRKEILDPQGKAVKLGLRNLGIKDVADVRVGKHIVLNLEASDEENAKKLVEEACQKLLANLIMEDYKFELKKVEN